MNLHQIKQEIADVHMEMGNPAHELDDHDDIIYIQKKPPRNDVIEYDPVELSLEDSEGSGILKFISCFCPF